jgi:uncharacterized protein (TIGR03067 family)
MRRFTLAFAAVAVSLLLPAAGPGNDLDRLQGRWVMVSLEINGEPVSEDQVASGKLIVEGNRYTPTYAGKAYPETCALDPDKMPRAIDFTYIDGPREGETVKGIYKLEGDRYVMCRALKAEDGRPRDFATKAESGLALVIWKRDSPAEDARRKAIAAERKAFEGTWVGVLNVRDGKSVAEDQARRVRLTLIDDRYTLERTDTTDRGTSRIDPTASPKTMDIAIIDGALKGRTLKGIYTLEGDTYKICFALDGKDRPTEFVSEPGSGNIFWVFQRSKP